MKFPRLKLAHVGYAAPHEWGGLGPFNPIFDKAEDVSNADSLTGMDAIVVWGGEDISPTFYDEEPYVHSGPRKPSERDVVEWHLIKEAKQKGLPMIGVCRGAQMMCAAAGGKLVQHVQGHNGGRHLITTNKGLQFSVSSLHHQMMYPFDVKHEHLAWSSERKSNDYFPEGKDYTKALEEEKVKEPELVFFNELNALAVQCHPEYHQYGDPFNIWFNKLIVERFFAL
jgi:GMP synthase-like glutamine amidotransferase